MSTELETRMKDHTLTRFWGGATLGVCLQITAKQLSFCETAKEQLQKEGFIQVSMEEAAALCADLSALLQRNRKELL